MLKLDMAALAKNEWVPDYESWHYSLAFAKVSLADSKSAEEVRKCISNMGYVVKEITELLSERRPSMVLSGLLKGATADCSKEDLSVIMKSAAAKNSIAGRIEVTECLKTKNGNAILRIRVDDIALERIRELNMELRLATAGKVRFSEANKTLIKSDAAREAATQRIKYLEEEIRKETDKITTLNMEVVDRRLGEMAVDELELLQSDAEERVEELSVSPKPPIPTGVISEEEATKTTDI